MLKTERGYSMAINMTLNDEQRKLVEDNHALIMWYVKRRNLDFDDWYDILAIALCTAAFYYDKDKGTPFSTFASVCMDSSVWMELRKRGRSIEGAVEMLSLEYEYHDDNGETYEFSDLIQDESINTENYVVTKIVLDNCKACLTKKEQHIIDMLLAGDRQTVVASKLGVSRQRVGQAVDKLRKRYYI